MPDYTIKDSGEREGYDSGMVRDVETDKPDYTLIYDGPIMDRYAAHLTKGAAKYGRQNWQLANSRDERDRFQRSAARHFRQWMAGETDEDHAAAVVFNMNAYEYVNDQIIEWNESVVSRPPIGEIVKEAREDYDTLQEAAEKFFGS
jgi:hypothetical protein